MTESETADVQPPKLRTLGINLLAKASYEHPTLVVTLAYLGLTEGIGRRVTYVRSDGVRTDENPILLGTTARYIFFFSPSTRTTEIVPVDAVTALHVDSRRRKEREQYSLVFPDSLANPDSGQ